MELANIKQNFIEIIRDRFAKKRKTVANNLALFTYCMLRSESCNTYEMCRHAHEITDKSFNANDRRLQRFLQSKEFQVDDSLWRCHIGLIFDILKEYGLKKGDVIAINIDTTSRSDDFLIIEASIPLNGRAIPIYFSMRRYPKRKGMINHKKFEEAFFKELRHLLSKDYQYVIVGDRGFGNNRIIELCKKSNFNYILRINRSLNIETSGAIKNIQNIDFNNYKILNAKVVKWNRETNVISSKKNGSKWTLLTDLKDFSFYSLNLQYGKRFHIEKMFQDQKSSGFSIESSKIRKYDRFKRLYYIACLAQSILMFIGNYIEDNACDIKKNFALHTKLILAFSNLQD